MKRFLVFVLLAGMALNMVHAQVVLPPTDPNEACAEAWNKYHKGDVLWKTGWGLFVPGVVGTALCSTLGFITSFTGYPPQEEPNPAPVICFSFMGLSAGAFIASIPCLIVGQVQRKKALKEYNEWNCAPELSCPEIVVNYKKGDILWKTGWGLFGAGCGLILTGTVLSCYYGGYPSRNSIDDYVIANAGDGILGVGCGAVIASFPCIAFGHVQRKAASNLYNTKCASETPLTFSIQSSANGLGLAMQF